VAVVGTSSAASPGRWAAAKTLSGPVSILDDAAADSSGAQISVLVSTASPSVLGRRLHEWASRPASKGQILAVISVGGPLRGDLPAALLAEGNLSALGIADQGLLDPIAAREWAKAWAEQAKSTASSGRRPEEIAGPFTWYY
jgi:hypothetical protein